MLRVCLAVVASLSIGCGVDLPAASPTPLPAHGTPSRIELSASPGIGSNGGTAMVTARVIDAYALALPAVAVAFHASTGDLAVTSVVTDSDGFARTTLTGPAGTVSIEAQAAAVRADVTVTVQPMAVNPVPPPVPPTPEPPPPAPQPFTVALSASPDTATPHLIIFGLMTQQAVVSAVWDFGDGSAPYQTTGSRASSTRHAYAAASTQKVTVKATDARGRVASDSIDLIVP